MRIEFNRFVFQGPMVPLLVALAVLPVFVKLGLWQLDRAHVKEAMIDAAVTAKTLAPVSVSIAELTDLPNYTRVSVSGVLTPAKQFLLDNQVYKNQAGFALLTPLYDATAGVIVNRGWIPMSFDRRPGLKLDAAAVSIINQEFILTRPSEGIVLGEFLGGAGDWPKITQAQNIEALSGALGKALIPVVLQPNSDAHWAFERAWTAVPSDPNKHYGYALQWFSFAALLVVLVAVLTIKPNRKVR